ncbi:MAG: FecR domain-containing protein [candidate division KSB1 bacterium]|nr:FecR domain-containing protein [candidate division KSB1 bacterium]MDZ7300587.1 FecR domain-containing protein [candidate division KSB1 bacterium]MDZ7309724.1 FecR domain-containing protein [candidate division KSB1 bacterium]
MNHIDHHELLTRYFSGEATADEQVRLEAWRRASPENQRLFAELEKIWSGAEPGKSPPIPDVSQSWSELAAKLGLPQEQPRAKILAMKKPLRGASQRLSWSDRYVWAAAAAILLALSAILHQALQKSDRLKTVATAHARQESLELPDGSMVRLNSGSEIQFPRNFADTARRVILSGEAYFEIIHDKRPFLVNTSNAQIRVLGTKFGIWARHEQTRVTVREGRVSLRALEAPPETAVTLAANQMSVCRRKENPEPPRMVDAEHLLGWLEGMIVFDQTPLAEVIAELQRVYNISIELSNPALGQATITGSFRHKPIESVLTSICLALNLQYTKEADRYVISDY